MSESPNNIMLKQVPEYLEVFTTLELQGDIDDIIDTISENLNNLDCEYLWDEKNNKFIVVAFYNSHPSIELNISLFHNSGRYQNKNFKQNSILIEVSRKLGSIIRTNTFFQKVKSFFGLPPNLYTLRPPTLIYTDIKYDNNPNYVILSYLSMIKNNYKNRLDGISGLYNIIIENNKINSTNFKNMYNVIFNLVELGENIAINDLIFQISRLLGKMIEYKNKANNKKMNKQISKLRSNIISHVQNKIIDDSDEFCLLYKQLIVNLN